jgi:hypothetical protein
MTKLNVIPVILDFKSNYTTGQLPELVLIENSVKFIVTLLDYQCVGLEKIDRPIY